MKWGNVTITKKEQDGDNIALYGKIDINDKDFKKTKKITWVAADADTTVEVQLVEFDHIITKKKIEEKDDVKDLVNKNSRIEYTAIAEGSLRNVQKGTVIQLERRGYFYVDQIALGEHKIRLHFIPDGKTKTMSAISHKIDAKEAAKGKGQGEAFANKSEAKKAGTEAAAADGEGKKPSKKELKKAQKKETKKAKKEEKKQETTQPDQS